jgi:asparagine synthase (glutamine-hydrolysing)
MIRPAVESLPSMRGSRFKGYVRLAKKMVRSGSLAPVDRFLMDSVYLTDAMQAELAPSLAQLPDARSEHLAHFAKVSDADFLDRMMYVDTKAFMVSLNLTYNDKMSMASSVEVRVPFLDWELAEWTAANIPPSMKLRGATTKHILREAMRPMLPAEVLTQKKAGFGAPADYWLANELREMVDDLLSETNIRRRGYFEPAPIRRMIEEQRSGREDWSLQIWQFLTFELWLRAFMD